MVRAQLDRLLAVLHDFAVFLDGTPGGAVLLDGRKSGLFDEDRSAAASQRLRRGTSRTMCIDRNTFAGPPFSAIYHGGLTRVHCGFYLGDSDMGTEIDLSYGRDDDAVSADEFREWVSRIEAASGMARNPSRCDVDEVPPEPHVLFDYRDFPEFYGESEVHEIPGVEDDCLPVVVSGVEISGWDRLGLELELSIVSAGPLSESDCAIIEALLEDWVDYGSGAGFGGGFFHGWLPGAWDGNEYHLSVDTGSQMVDWAAAIRDLAARVAAVSSEIASDLSIGLGP